MTGLDGARVYLDWNATAPLRPEARAAMIQAMDVVGNPSSVHGEGRTARAIVEHARAQVARLVGCEPSEIVFTSGATEAANIVIGNRWDCIALGDTEHDAVHEPAILASCPTILFSGAPLELDAPVFSFHAEGKAFRDEELQRLWAAATAKLACLQDASGETGVVQTVGTSTVSRADICWLRDATQLVGRAFRGADGAWQRYRDTRGKPAFTIMSAHKLGGPKGVGALVVRAGQDLGTTIRGGGQEMGRRSGTENVIGIAGFGAAAEAAQQDQETDVWAPVEKLRNILEDALAAAARETIFFGQESLRLPNTSCFAVPGWRGETQVMQMDLAGFAVSAGSACSSGKVRESRVLRAMGYDAETASSAIRVSMGPTTTEAEVLAFADAWTTAYNKRRGWAERPKSA
ncbi:MAG: aminotransferase class V-fold PLP-dependent enzyme [Pseudomonadota bacterium]